MASRRCCSSYTSSKQRSRSLFFLAGVGLLDTWLLYRFFRNQTFEALAAGPQPGVGLVST